MWPISAFLQFIVIPRPSSVLTTCFPVKPKQRPPYTGTKTRRRRKTTSEERICPVCAQSFKKAEHLARHLRSHTKEKPFNCSVCKKAFARQDTLLRHSRSHLARNEDYAEVHAISLGSDHQGVLDPDIMSDPPMVAGRSTVALQIEAGITDDMIQAPASPPNSTSIDKQTPNLSIGDPNTYPSQVTPLTSFFSVEAGDIWRSQVSPPPPLWDSRLEREWETLLAGDDFDLDAVNMSLLCATSDYVPTAENLSGLGTMEPTSQPLPIDEQTKRHANTVQKKWHTFSAISLSSQMTPDIPHESNFIDESYRKRLAEGLQARQQHGILPSTPFLDLCIQAYFSKFHPLFPVVHMPSFRPGTQNSILLLSICSVGSLIVGSPRAINHGVSMFERLNKAILASWDTYISKSEDSSLVALQASIIGQTFGLLMGRPKDLTGIEIFHGSIIAWARKAQLFKLQHPEYDLDVDSQALEDTWMSWVRTEVKQRLVLGLYIHDAQLARLHHHEPVLRHSLDRLPRISSDDLFAASSATHWKALMLESQMTLSSPTSHPERTSNFALCGSLESISAIACEDHSFANDWASTSRKCHPLLSEWHSKYAHSMAGKSGWSCLMMLWHSIYIMLHIDFNALECACGREGYDAVQKHTPYARSWVRSTDAKRALLHAMLIQRHFESLPVGVEPAIHVPMCLYYCGVIWACFICFSDRGDVDEDPVSVSAADAQQFAELRLPGVDGIRLCLEETGAIVPRRLATGSMFRIIDLLKRISHWKIAKSLAATLLALSFSFKLALQPTEETALLLLGLLRLGGLLGLVLLGLGRLLSGLLGLGLGGLGLRLLGLGLFAALDSGLGLLRLLGGSSSSGRRGGVLVSLGGVDGSSGSSDGIRRRGRLLVGSGLGDGRLGRGRLHRLLLLGLGLLGRGLGHGLGRRVGGSRGRTGTSQVLLLGRSAGGSLLLLRLGHLVRLHLVVGEDGLLVRALGVSGIALRGDSGGLNGLGMFGRARGNGAGRGSGGSGGLLGGSLGGRGVDVGTQGGILDDQVCPTLILGVGLESLDLVLLHGLLLSRKSGRSSSSSSSRRGLLDRLFRLRLLLRGLRGLGLGGLRTLSLSGGSGGRSVGLAHIGGPVLRRRCSGGRLRLCGGRLGLVVTIQLLVLGLVAGMTAGGGCQSCATYSSVGGTRPPKVRPAMRGFFCVDAYFWEVDALSTYTTFFAASATLSAAAAAGAFAPPLFFFLPPFLGIMFVTIREVAATDKNWHTIDAMAAARDLRFGDGREEEVQK
ncbi:hypothetical protein N7532_012049 [Penicillium argentinense]|uniref:C2H2-type domain-containing protein n=1 Tax=Penicillium argentinense TaxID=1131581 RepID=A0A9W9EJU9_9EURO|nr:uncharacterized protein N7532_012049 [Penicillium argentinense]KAJ5083006.1 hypothetical protein N7532_012049 [Penicillium argentinense]